MSHLYFTITPSPSVENEPSNLTFLENPGVESPTIFTTSILPQPKSGSHKGVSLLVEIESLPLGSLSPADMAKANAPTICGVAIDVPDFCP